MKGLAWRNTGKEGLAAELPIDRKWKGLIHQETVYRSFTFETPISTGICLGFQASRIQKWM